MTQPASVSGVTARKTSASSSRKTKDREMWRMLLLLQSICRACVSCAASFKRRREPLSSRSSILLSLSLILNGRRRDWRVAVKVAAGKGKDAGQPSHASLPLRQGWRVNEGHMVIT